MLTPVPSPIFAWIRNGLPRPLVPASHHVAAEPAKKQQPLAAKGKRSRVKAIDPAAFAHLRSAIVETSRQEVVLSETDDFAQKVLAAQARMQGKRFDPAAFIVTPPPPPNRHPSAKEILAAVRKCRPALLKGDK